MLHKIPMTIHTLISVMLVCKFVYDEALFDFEAWLESIEKALVMDSLYAWNFVKKWLLHRWFPVAFAKLPRTTTL